MSMGMSTATRVSGQVAAALFVLAIPLLMITNSVTWAVNDLRLYHYGFDKYDVPRVTGIEIDDLKVAARQIRGYFNSTTEPLDIRTRIHGEERELFSQREVVHMGDVKRLIWGVYVVDIAASVYLLGYMGLSVLILRRPIVPTVSTSLLWGCGLTIGLVVLVGLISLVGFDSLFLAFHRVSFANDFWQLDPQRDYLVMMFPRGFWFDATIVVALAAVGQAVALAAITWGFLTLRRRRIRRIEGPVLGRPSEATEL